MPIHNKNASRSHYSAVAAITASLSGNERWVMVGNVFGLHSDGQGHQGLEEGRRRVAEALENTADELDLGGLQLTSIPESIGALKQLKTLSLNNNRLTSFPEILSELPELRSLDLSLNDLASDHS
jgi:Leucine Rich Repeat (LRR) protein